ncbi:hypothetical protein BGZ94_000775, partial [Podila epigama]
MGNPTEKFTLLPTTAGEQTSFSSDPPAYAPTPATTDPLHNSATQRRRRLRLGIFKLWLVGMVIFALFWPVTMDDSLLEQGENTTEHRPSSARHHHRHRRPKHKSSVHFEKHMLADVEQLISGSLESDVVWDRLAEMTDTYGHRLVGSAALEK